MLIDSMFQTKPHVFSLEVFPPRQTDGGVEQLFGTLQQLAALAPDFISVTYGAGASAAGENTLKIAAYLQNQLHITSLAHMTCVNHTKESAADLLNQIVQNGIENILALRGDRPSEAALSDFAHASDLACFIKQKTACNVVGACYPEGHVESENLIEDVADMHYKIDAGVTHLITQLFFDNSHFFRYMNMLRKSGIAVPVQAGVMPITSLKQVARTVSLSSASLPPAFTKMLSKYENDANSLYDAGIDYAINQIRDLLEGGTDGIHLYAMNNPQVAARVHAGIQDLLQST